MIESSITIHESGHHIFSSSNNTSRSNGVGFLVHKSIVDSVLDYVAISDRLAKITLQASSLKLSSFRPTSQLHRTPMKKLKYYMNKLALF